MKRQFEERFNGVSSERVVQERYKDPDFERALHNEAGGALLEWLLKSQVCNLRYRVDISFSRPLIRLLGSTELEVSEKRQFSFDGSRYHIESHLETQLGYLHADITRVLNDTAQGCVENTEVNAVCEGKAFSGQIVGEFLMGLFRHIYPIACFDESVWSAEEETKGFHMPSKKDETFVCIIEDVLALKNSAVACAKVVTGGRPPRRPLDPPHMGQIEQVCELVDKSNFSIQEEINQMRAVTDDTQRLLNEFKKVRSETATSRSLPIFVLVSCIAAIVAIINS